LGYDRRVCFLNQRFLNDDVEMNRNAVVTIVENSEITQGVYRLVLSDAFKAHESSPSIAGRRAVADIAAAAAPGQFVNLYLNNKSMLLPRPFGISDVDTSGYGEPGLVFVYAVRGAGTAELSSYGPGTEIRALGPNGNGYDVERVGRRVFLVGGGLGIPPLLFAARRIREGDSGGGRVNITALLGYAGDAFYSEEMRPYCDDVFEISESMVVGYGSNESARGSVMDLIARLVSDGVLDLSGASVLSCGPTPMLRAVSEWTEANGIPAQISLEGRMGCGYGACVGCTIAVRAAHSPLAPDAAADTERKTVMDDTASACVARKKICKDGPVFASNMIVWDSSEER
jgi:dihydroorotate dehydrogenase electron transfer subunit